MAERSASGGILGDIILPKAPRPVTDPLLDGPRLPVLGFDCPRPDHREPARIVMAASDTLH